MTTPRYYLEPAAIAQLTSELLAADHGRSQRIRCYRLDGADPHADLARNLEREVFDAAFGNTAQAMTREYGPYDNAAASLFFLCVDADAAVPVGALRVIQPSQAGLKTINDLADPAKVSTTISTAAIADHHGITDWADCWDIGTVAVARQYRHSVQRDVGISTLLFRAMYVSAMAARVAHCVAMIDAGAYRLSHLYLGVPLVALGDSPPMSYLGSASTRAVYGYFPSFQAEMSSWRRYLPRRLAAPAAYRVLVDGANDDRLRFAR
ncbi:hypothetical protein [Nocardia salmonicida]|uniref:hypothetical protein n=1 Tax=Nocardia salmonicida TaxID=53431 RepID=UPI003CEA2A3F